MGHRTHRRRQRAGERPLPSQGELSDRRWAADLRSTLACASSLLALLLLVDEAAGTFTAARAALWSGLALLLFLVLFPPRVTAGEGWLAVRGLLHTRRVRTDRLVSVRASGSSGQRLVFRDSLGSHVELDPQVLVANPPLWRRLDTDTRKAAADGHQFQYPEALHRLAERIDRETAWTVFKISGLADEADEPSAR